MQTLEIPFTGIFWGGASFKLLAGLFRLLFFRPIYYFPPFFFKYRDNFVGVSEFVFIVKSQDKICLNIISDYKFQRNQ
jgi:hypothetical protein